MLAQSIGPTISSVDVNPVSLIPIEQVGIDDNFFELGGDSILVLQLIARANQAGLQLIPKHLFQYQTIAELATVVGTSGLEAEQGPVTGPLPLTPIQHWFFEENLSDPHHWNQSILLEIRQALDPVKLEQALQQLLEHHDALRLRFERTKSGWQQVNASPDQVVPTSICQRCQILNQGQLSRQPLPNYRLV